jgi:hypothetical protein
MESLTEGRGKSHRLKFMNARAVQPMVTGKLRVCEMAESVYGCLGSESS